MSISINAHVAACLTPSAPKELFNGQKFVKGLSQLSATEKVALATRMRVGREGSPTPFRMTTADGQREFLEIEDVQRKLVKGVLEGTVAERSRDELIKAMCACNVKLDPETSKAIWHAKSSLILSSVQNRPETVIALKFMGEIPAKNQIEIAHAVCSNAPFNALAENALLACLDKFDVPEAQITIANGLAQNSKNWANENFQTFVANLINDPAFVPGNNDNLLHAVAMNFSVVGRQKGICDAAKTTTLAALMEGKFDDITNENERKVLSRVLYLDQDLNIAPDAIIYDLDSEPYLNPPAPEVEVETTATPSNVKDDKADAVVHQHPFSFVNLLVQGSKLALFGAAFFDVVSKDRSVAAAPSSIGVTNGLPPAPWYNLVNQFAQNTHPLPMGELNWNNAFADKKVAVEDGGSSAENYRSYSNSPSSFEYQTLDLQNFANSGKFTKPTKP